MKQRTIAALGARGGIVAAVISVLQKRRLEPITINTPLLNEGTDGAVATSPVRDDPEVTLATEDHVIYRHPNDHTSHRSMTGPLLRSDASRPSSVAGYRATAVVQAQLIGKSDPIAPLVRQPRVPTISHHQTEQSIAFELVNHTGGREPWSMLILLANGAASFMTRLWSAGAPANSGRLRMSLPWQGRAHSGRTDARSHSASDPAGWTKLTHQASKGSRDRVLLVAHQYWPTPGSATQVLDALTRSLIKAGATVHVVTCRPRGMLDLPDVGPHGEYIHFSSRTDSSGARLMRVLDLASFSFSVWRIGRQLDFDLIITDPPPTAAWAARRLARRRMRPMAYYFADTWGGVTGDSRNPVARLAHPAVTRLEHSLLRSADLVIAVTEQLRDVAVTAGARNVELVLNGVSVEQHSPLGSKWFPTNASDPFLLYAGNAGVVHGATVFAEAAERLWSQGYNFSVVYMGHGSDSSAIETIAKRWPNRLITLSNQPSSTVAAAFRGAVGALSSLRPIASYEGARPIKTMTGLACGCPAIYVGSGQFADEIREQNLGFVRDWSVDGAEQAMKDALAAAEDDVGYTSFRTYCAVYAARKFDSSVGADRVAQLSLQLIREHGKS